MITAGQMGEVPDWYPLIRASKYLGVPPWELAARPTAWTSWALRSMQAENEAEEELLKREQRKANRKRR